jgi:hypothetical protein
MAVLMIVVAAAAIATVLLRALVTILAIAAGVTAAVIIFPFIGLTPHMGIAAAALITFAVGASIYKLQFSEG